MAKFQLQQLTAKGRERGKGLYPIYIVAYHERKRKYFFTDYACKITEWSESKSQFKGTFKKGKTENPNKNLLNLLDRCEKIAKEITDGGREFSLSTFSKRFNSKDLTDVASVLEAKRLTTTGSTYEWYHTTENALNSFKEGIPVRDFDNDTLENFIKWLKSTRTIQMKTNSGEVTTKIVNPLSDGGINSYLRAIRAAFNYAIEQKTIPPHLKPNITEQLKKFKAGGKKRSLPKDILDKIFTLNFEDERTAFALEVFQLSLLLRGINFADLIELRPDHIKTLGSEKRLQYKRRKVSTEFDLRINTTAFAIIEKYLNDPLIDHRGFILPVLNENIHTTDRKILNRKKHFLNKYVNKYLKGPVSDALGLENFDFTSYVARHSYASTLKASGESTEIISKALGHRDKKTTETYLTGITDYSIDNLDKKIWGE
jgi:integrase